MSLKKNMIHAVWGTKNRFPFLKEEKLTVIINEIKKNAKIKGLHITDINGHDDHMHIIISLNRDLTISKTMQLIKGQSSFWANQNKIFSTNFEWADEYYAVSVSESQLPNVRDYIARQKEHHSKKSFEKECEEFMKKYNFESLN